MRAHPINRKGFTLAEVVLALGVIAFAIVAILGVIPVGLNTSHSAQDETKAAQIAEDILDSLAGQATSNYNNASIVQDTVVNGQPVHFQYGIPLNRDYDYQPLGATNEGSLQANYNQSLPYQITISTKASPVGFDPGYGCLVSVRVAWRPFAQNYRDYVRIISKY